MAKKKKAKPVEETDIEVNIWNMPAVFVLETRMPEAMVDDLNSYLDDLRESEDKESLAGTLVGQIAHGEQLNMDPEHEKVRSYSKFVTSRGAQYINHFMQNTGNNLGKNRQVAVDETWSVHSYEGDYNPIHDHGTQTVMGISCTTWTKVPPQITQGPRPGSQDYGLYNASGESDGCLCFNYGQSSSWDKERLRPTQNIVVRPQVGRLYMFPQWMQHMVYPFKGEGERRTVAANLNCFRQELAA